MVSSILGITVLLPFGNILEENCIMVHYLTTYINNCILFLEAICYLVYTRMAICYLFWYILKCKSRYNIQTTLIIKLGASELWKESLNNNGQQFHQYHQTRITTSHLKPLNTTKTPTYRVGHPGPGSDPDLPRRTSRSWLRPRHTA